MEMVCQMVLSTSDIITNKVIYGAIILCKVSIFAEIPQDCRQMQHILV